MRILPMLTGLAALCFANAASAHAFLQTATPAVGATVHAAPNAVTIGFTEGVEPAFSTITVQNAAGDAVQDGTVRRQDDDHHLTVALKPLAAGQYKVIWHAVSTDTHKTQGSFTFTVAP